MTTMQITQFVVDLLIVYYASAQIFLHRTSQGFFPFPSIPSNLLPSFRSFSIIYLTTFRLTHALICAYSKQATMTASHSSCLRPPIARGQKTPRCSGAASLARTWACSSSSLLKRMS